MILSLKLKYIKFPDFFPELSLLPFRIIFSIIEICLQIKQTPRKNTQIWHYINSLGYSELVRIITKSKDQRGRSSYVILNNLPLVPLENFIIEKLNDKMEGSYDKISI